MRTICMLMLFAAFACTPRETSDKTRNNDQSAQESSQETPSEAQETSDSYTLEVTNGDTLSREAVKSGPISPAQRLALTKLIQRSDRRVNIAKKKYSTRLVRFSLGGVEYYSISPRSIQRKLPDAKVASYWAPEGEGFYVCDWKSFVKFPEE